MEEIKVGNFIRTKDGVIAKVTYVDVMMVDCDRDVFDLNNLAMMEIPTEYIEEYIVKHSSNIKDLIQAGDIVIYTINCKMTDIDIVKEHTDARTLEKSLRVGLWSLEQVNIKQILTKERFESESYRLEE